MFARTNTRSQTRKKRHAEPDDEPANTVAKQPSCGQLDASLLAFIPLVKSATAFEHSSMPVFPLRAAAQVDLEQFAHVDSPGSSLASQRPCYIVDAPTDGDPPTFEVYTRAQKLVASANTSSRESVILVEPDASEPVRRRHSSAASKKEHIVSAITSDRILLS